MLPGATKMDRGAEFSLCPIDGRYFANFRDCGAAFDVDACGDEIGSNIRSLGVSLTNVSFAAFDCIELHDGLADVLATSVLLLRLWRRGCGDPFGNRTNVTSPVQPSKESSSLMDGRATDFLRTVVASRQSGAWSRLARSS